MLKKSGSKINMGITGNDIVCRLLSILKERGIKQYVFFNKIGIAKQAITRWKKGSFPSCDAIVIIARELNISIDWLLTGETGFDSSDSTSPASVVNRLIDRIEVLTNHKIYENFPGFYQRIEDIISPFEVTDWFLGRQKINLGKLCLIADRIGLSIQYLLTGSNISKEEYANHNRKKNDLDKKLYLLNKENEDFVKEVTSLCLKNQLRIRR